jgi:hypothetical protein
MANIVPFDSKTLPAYLSAANPNVNDELGGGGGGFKVMGFKGKVFAVKDGGTATPVMKDGAPAPYIDVVVVKVWPLGKDNAKVYYAQKYTEGSDAKPDCYSNDGIGPDPSVEKPQAKKCSVCPKNEWGSKVTEDGKKVKACTDSRRLAVAAPDKLDEPILLRVPPASLKPLAEYGGALAKAGAPYNAVITKIGFERVAAPQLTFKFIEFLEEDQYAQVQKVIADDVVASILGKPGETPVPDAEEAEETPAPVAEPEPVKPAPKKIAKAAAVTEAEVEAVVEPKAEKPAPKKAEPKVSESENLEDELDALLGDLDD